MVMDNDDNEKWMSVSKKRYFATLHFSFLRHINFNLFIISELFIQFVDNRRTVQIMSETAVRSEYVAILIWKSRDVSRVAFQVPSMSFLILYFLFKCFLSLAVWLNHSNLTTLTYCVFILFSTLDFVHGSVLFHVLCRFLS